MTKMVILYGSIYVHQQYIMVDPTIIITVPFLSVYQLPNLTSKSMTPKTFKTTWKTELVHFSKTDNNIDVMDC